MIPHAVMLMITHGRHCWPEFHPYYWWSTHWIHFSYRGTTINTPPGHGGWIEWLCR